MPVKRRNAKVTRQDVSPVAWAMILDEPLPDPDSSKTKWEHFALNVGDRDHMALVQVNGDPTLYAIWLEVRGEVLDQWAKDKPGTRPNLWWRWDAPRLKAGQLAGRLIDEDDARYPEPRLRVGGVGTPNYEVLNYVPAFYLGMPVSWVCARDAEYYNGRSRDIHGSPIGTDYKEGDFLGLPLNPDDPPTYESEAAYLLRHDLLLQGERGRLTSNDFKPNEIDARGLLEAGRRVYEEVRDRAIQQGSWRGE